tara:strand:- start:1446 stop:1865 length:420 start_codon:yes stop_codon:yes gene_type:complete
MECRYCHEKGHTISRCDVLIKKKRSDDKRRKGSGQVIADKNGWVQCGVVCQEVDKKDDAISLVLSDKIINNTNKSINKFDLLDGVDDDQMFDAMVHEEKADEVKEAGEKLKGMEICGDNGSKVTICWGKPLSTRWGDDD